MPAESRLRASPRHPPDPEPCRLTTLEGRQHHVPPPTSCPRHPAPGRRLAGILATYRAPLVSTRHALVDRLLIRRKSPSFTPSALECLTLAGRARKTKARDWEDAGVLMGSTPLDIHRPSPAAMRTRWVSHRADALPGCFASPRCFSGTAVVWFEGTGQPFRLRQRSIGVFGTSGHGMVNFAAAPLRTAAPLPGRVSHKQATAYLGSDDPICQGRLPLGRLATYEYTAFGIVLAVVCPTARLARSNWMHTSWIHTPTCGDRPAFSLRGETPVPSAPEASPRAGSRHNLSRIGCWHWWHSWWDSSVTVGRLGHAG